MVTARMAPSAEGASAIRVLVIGQTPPPYGGQTVMIQALLSHPVEGIEYRHVRMAFSREMVDIGRASVGKVLHLLSVVARSLWAIVSWRPDVVYYPPGGPARVPVVRDVAVLLAVRPFARRLVLQFHAGGTSEVWRRGFRSRWAARLFRQAFFGADAVIVQGPHAHPDGQVLEAKRTVVIANGIADERIPPVSHDPLNVLYVGVHLEVKGVFDLAAACRRLWDAGVDFTLTTVGEVSPATRSELVNRAGPHAGRLRIKGVLTGEPKWREYATADVLVNPSVHPSETFGLTLVEAMVFGLPVIATDWLGFRDVVVETETGRLVAPHAPPELADALEALLRDRELRAAYGSAGRRRYEALYTLDRFVTDVALCLREVGRA